MKVKELKELLNSVPDEYDIAVVDDCCCAYIECSKVDDECKSFNLAITEEYLE